MCSTKSLKAVHQHDHTPMTETNERQEGCRALRKMADSLETGTKKHTQETSIDSKNETIANTTDLTLSRNLRVV